jgi:hypothetical protein
MREHFHVSDSNQSDFNRKNGLMDPVQVFMYIRIITSKNPVFPSLAVAVKIGEEYPCIGLFLFPDQE